MISTNSPPSPSPLFHALALSRWILSPDKWGGAIELSILCAHYAREIAAYDIRTQRCDLYGQGAGEGHVCMDMHGRSGAWMCMGAVVHGYAWARPVPLLSIGALLLRGLSPTDRPPLRVLGASHVDI